MNALTITALVMLVVTSVGLGSYMKWYHMIRENRNSWKHDCFCAKDEIVSLKKELKSREQDYMVLSTEYDDLRKNLPPIIK